MKVAVTGASGFVGRHVIAELKRRKVEVFDSRVDLHDTPVDMFERLGAPDVLIHLAWHGLPNYRSPHHVQQELPAQYRFIESLVASGLKNVLVSGTCFEYGLQSGALREDMETAPSTPYAVAKDTLRRELESLRKERSFAFTWTRLFYLHGEGQAESSLLSQLTRAAERGDRIFNMSGGEQLRDYLPIEDAAGYLVSLALETRDNGIVNVCSGNPISIRSLVERWVEERGWAIELGLGHYPYADYEPMEFWGDRSKLDGLLAASNDTTRQGPPRC